MAHIGAASALACSARPMTTGISALRHSAHVRTRLTLQSLYTCLTSTSDPLSARTGIPAPILAMLAFVPVTYLLFWALLISLHVFNRFFVRTRSGGPGAPPRHAGIGSGSGTGIYSSRRLTRTLKSISLALGTLILPYHACVILGSWSWKPRAIAWVCEDERYKRETAFLSLGMQALGLMSYFSGRHERPAAVRPQGGQGTVQGEDKH